MFIVNGESFKGFGRACLYVFIAVFPFLLYQAFIFNGSSTRALNLVLLVEVLAVSLAFVFFKRNVKLSIAKSPITIALFVFLLSLFVSSLAGVDFTISFWSKITRTTGLYYFIHLGLFYMLITMLFREEGHMRKLMKVFLWSAAIFSIGSLLSKDGFGLIFAHREWQGFTFGNSTFAAMYLLSAFILSIYLIRSMELKSRKWWHYLAPIVFILNPYFINADIWLGRANIFSNPLAVIGSAQSSTYALIFSVLALLTVWGISKIKSVQVRKGFIWGGVVLGLIVGVFAIHSFLSPGGAIQAAYLKGATNARPIVWQLSREAIAERPLLGYGVDNFDRAYEAHYDNKVMEKANGAEAWFDRAHNIFIDQTIETGYVGVIIYILVFLAIIGSMLYVLLRSINKNDQTLAVVIIVYLVAHLMELQTAFDTTISYIPLVLMAALAGLVFHKTYSLKVGEKSEWQVPRNFKYALGVLLIGIFGTLFFVGTIPIARAQIANGTVRTIGSSAKRLQIYPILFNSPMDAAGLLNRTFVDIQRGVSVDPSILDKPANMEGFKKEFELLAVGYEKYLESHPIDYRARATLVDLYVYQKLYMVDNLNLALADADKAIALVPQAPQAYWMKSVAYLYQRKFDLAREWAKKAHDLNPNIEESQRLVKYIEDSIKTFPEIDLYTFKQI